jgi:hypothetical protein
MDSHRELHRHGDILFDFEQIKPGNVRPADIGLVISHIEPFGGVSLKMNGKPAAKSHRVAQDNTVRQRKQIFWFTTGIRTANHGSPAQGSGSEENVANIIFLDAHFVDHDEVGPKDVTVQQIGKAAIDQSQLSVLGHSAAMVSKPRGGSSVSSGMSSIAASKLQKEGGKRPDHQDFDR